MRMRRGAWRRAVALERGRPKLENGSECTRESEVAARLLERGSSGSESDERNK
jgi:hypothetical protein